MEFGWRQRGKPQKTPVRVVSVLAGAQTNHLLNIRLESYCYMNMLDPQKRIVSVLLGGIIKGVISCPVFSFFQFYSAFHSEYFCCFFFLTEM